MEKQFENIIIPDNYLDTLEDKVIKTYHKRRRIKTIKLISLTLAVVTVTGLSFYSLNRELDNSIRQENLLSLQDTSSYMKNMINTEEKITPLPQNTQTDSGITPPKHQKKTVKKEIKTPQSFFTQQELDYLEPYLNEDNYELVYNSINR